ncbi:MAG TPA: hypothetical protein PKD08_07410 [Gudongella oleilytica]|nr:hypothetical protein [Gudongella oleilytica]
MDKKAFDIAWKAPVNKIGRFTLLAAVLLSFAPLIYLYVAHGILPEISDALKSWGMIATIFGVMYFVEPISFYSILDFQVHICPSWLET